MRSITEAEPIVSEQDALLAWCAGREALATAKLEAWGDLAALVSCLTVYCQQLVQYHVQAIRASAAWYGRSLARIVAERDVRARHAFYTELLTELQAFTSKETPPPLAVTDQRETYWEKVVVWLERERVYLEGRWLTADVSFAVSGTAKS